MHCKWAMAYYCFFLGFGQEVLEIPTYSVMALGDCSVMRNFSLAKWKSLRVWN